MAAVAVVIAPFYVVIIITTRQMIGLKSLGVIVLMPLVGLMQIVAVFNLIDYRVE